MFNRKFIFAAILAATLTLPVGVCAPVQAADDIGIMVADRKDWKHNQKNWQKGKDHRKNRNYYDHREDNRHDRGDYNGHNGGRPDRHDFNASHRPGEHNGRPGPRPGEMRGPGNNRGEMPPQGRPNFGGPDFQNNRPNFGGPAHGPEGMRPGQGFPNGRPDGFPGGMHPGAR